MHKKKLARTVFFKLIEQVKFISDLIRMHYSSAWRRWSEIIEQLCKKISEKNGIIIIYDIQHLYRARRLHLWREKYANTLFIYVWSYFYR